MDQLKRTFRPEFLNRIDDIIVFSQLNKENIREIARRLVKSVSTRLSALGITLSVEDSALDILADKGFDVSYGARPLKRAIQSLIEDKIAERMLEGSIKNGDSITAFASEGNIDFKKTE